VTGHVVVPFADAAGATMGGYRGLGFGVIVAPS